MVTPQRQIVLHLPFQHHLCVLQGLIVEQPVQFCPLRRGVAVLVLHGDAVDGKGGAIDCIAVKSFGFGSFFRCAAALFCRRATDALSTIYKFAANYL